MLYIYIGQYSASPIFFSFSMPDEGPAAHDTLFFREGKSYLHRLYDKINIMNKENKVTNKTNMHTLIKDSPSNGKSHHINIKYRKFVHSE